ncbi:MAG: hypothetical protein K2O69_03125, partial [Odoribacter sp.]|nr:hypothetical protein [Odoribacter sp.]
MKKHVWKCWLKRTLWGLLALITVVLLVVGIVLNFVFTPSKLTPVVEKIAGEYLNAEVRFSNIELTFFSTFPDFGVRMDSVAVVSKVYRDSTMQQGLPFSAQDSLMSISSCLLTVNPVAYLVKNRIVIKNFILEHPRIYACIDTA